MKELIERLEKAEGPDRNLDAMIHWQIKNGVGVGAAQDAPHYTASLDAAMTLVPSGYQWDMTAYGSGAHASVGGTKKFGTAHDAKTPALALCIAALHSRSVEPAKTEGKDNG